ncbi:MAG: glycoside hydrolase family 13 protein [Lachnospiraceae bacterium]|nr:glycoside hydrolase family 13 protein [Lachnospiraceae bacterium]
MNPLHIFSDESRDHLLPLNEAGAFCFRLRMDDCGAQVFLVCRGGDPELIPMEPAEKKGRLRYYQTTLTDITANLFYYYEIRAEKTWYLGRFCCTEDAASVTPFAILPDLKVPEWAKGQIFYQIFPDRFCNGCQRNDIRDGAYVYPKVGPVEQVKDWDEPPAALDVARFYGGDLQGIAQKLPYLKALGVDCLYLNPIFVSPSNHGYDIADYYHIEPRLSDPADPDGYFASFVELLHENGIRLILDGVFNHCSIDNAWAKDPKKADYFVYDENGDHQTWWNISTLPKLNYEGGNRLWKEIMTIAKKWVSPPYNADGWRLDVATDVADTLATNHRFWETFRKTVRKAAPDSLVFAETYQNPEDWLIDGEWDTIMNYEAFMDPVTWFFTGVEKHSDHAEPGLKGDAEAFYWALCEKSSRLPFDSMLAAMNSLDNHDHSRFITRTGGHVGRITSENAREMADCADLALVRMAVCFQFTWPGAPCIYYGDETGLPGFTDPDDRRTFPWGKENWELIEYYRQAAALRKRFACLRTGSVHMLKFDSGIAAFARSLGEETTLTAVNMGGPAEFELDLAGLGMETGFAVREFAADGAGYTIGHVSFPVREGTLRLQMREKSAIVLSLREEPGDNE